MGFEKCWQVVAVQPLTGLYRTVLKPNHLPKNSAVRFLDTVVLEGARSYELRTAFAVR